MNNLAHSTTTALSNPSLASSSRVKKTRAKRAVKQTRFDKGELGYNGMSYRSMCRVDRLEESYDLVLGGLGDVLGQILTRRLRLESSAVVTCTFRAGCS